MVSLSTLVDDNNPAAPSSPRSNNIGNVTWPTITAVHAAGCPVSNVSGGAVVVGCFEFAAAPARKAVLLMNFEAAFNVYANVEFGDQATMWEVILNTQSVVQGTASLSSVALPLCRPSHCLSLTFHCLPAVRCTAFH